MDDNNRKETPLGGVAAAIQRQFGNVKETVSEAHKEAHSALREIHEKTGHALHATDPNKEEDKKKSGVLQSLPQSNMLNSSVGKQVQPGKLPRAMGGRSRSKKRSRSKTHKKKKKSRSKKGAGAPAYFLTKDSREKIITKAMDVGKNDRSIYERLDAQKVVKILNSKADAADKSLNGNEFKTVKEFADNMGMNLDFSQGNVSILHRGGSNCHNTKKKKKGRKARKARKSKKAKKHKKRGKKGGISRKKKAGCKTCGCRK